MSRLFLPVEIADAYPIEVIKCNCGSVFCQRHYLSVGTFHQGTGWDKDVAEWIAATLNAAVDEARGEA